MSQILSTWFLVCTQSLTPIDFFMVNLIYDVRFAQTGCELSIYSVVMDVSDYPFVEHFAK